MLTNANELLTDKGIQGKIAQVGKGFGTGRHTAFLAGSQHGYQCGSAICLRNQSASPPPKQVYQVKGVSPVASDFGSKVDLNVASHRSKNAQVTSRRFSVVRFDAQIQTGEDLIFTKKVTIDIETDPMQLSSDLPKTCTLQVQTDPQIEESWDPCEPVSVPQPRDTRSGN